MSSFLLTSCGSSVNYKELKIKLSKIIPSAYDSLEIWIRDKDGKTLYFSESPKAFEHRISIDDFPKKIQVLVRAKKGDSYVMEGVSPLISPEDLDRVEILFLPSSKSIIFPVVKDVVSYDVWAYPYELSDSLYIFTEKGRIFRISYVSWRSEEVGSFTPRKNFTLFGREYKDKNSIFIVGGEDGERKLDIVEVFVPNEAVFTYGQLNYKRSGAKALTWQDVIIILGGDSEGYCEAITQSGIKAFPCGITGRFSPVVLSQSKGLIKVLLYYKNTGKTQMIYIMRTRDEFEVSYVEDIKSIKRINGEVVKQGDKTLLFGGYGDSGYIQECEIYDPETNSFVVSGYYNTPRVDFSAVDVEGNIFIVGGRDQSGSAILDIDAMRGCVFEETGKTLSFPPKPSDCVFNLFSSYIMIFCQGAIPEIFPILSFILK
ncbi:MAG: hypothetical protein NZ927_09215 [Candidatus Calescibacterium sp.]|nr:hypothetical protein [Candidatus Calescibacterium sp.]MCX7734138.1 hypothetical protein [bacterium]MDW8087869.1 hypothetical protein [Candidatus Calescibacterium sp.]